MNFRAWMRQVDAELVRICGLDSRCLADQTYHDWYDSGVEPYEAAIMTLENEGFPFEG